MAYFSDAFTKQKGEALTRSHTLLSHFFSDLADLLAEPPSCSDALRLREAPAEEVAFVVTVERLDPEGDEVTEDAFGEADDKVTGLEVDDILTAPR